MNNLKFRVWSKKLSELKYFTFDDIGHAQYMTEPDVRYVWSKDHVTIIPLIEENIVTQWTGLLDKSGKEVYEGDIVSYKEGYKVSRLNPAPITNYRIRTEIVKYSNGAFSAGPYCFTNMILNTTNVEVIGNIFEGDQPDQEVLGKYSPK